MDETIVHLINEQWTAPALDLFMGVVSRADIWIPFFVAAGLALIIFDGFRGRGFVLITLLVLGLTNLVVDPLKSTVGRPRPKQVQSARLVELQKTRPMLLTIFKKPRIRLSGASDRATSGASFPSGHTNNNTVIAICCTLFYRRWGKLYWIVAVAVAYSRIYLGAHWPSDVIATFFLATGETLLILALCEWVWLRWLAPRWPALAARHPHLLPAARVSDSAETEAKAGDWS